MRVSTYATNTLKILVILWIKKLKVNDCNGSKVKFLCVYYPDIQISKSHYRYL